jgi:hypothetical protein
MNTILLLFKTKTKQIDKKKKLKKKIAEIFNCNSIVSLGICCRAMGNAEALVSISHAEPADQHLEGVYILVFVFVFYTPVYDGMYSGMVIFFVCPSVREDA